MNKREAYLRVKAEVRTEQCTKTLTLVAEERFRVWRKNGFKGMDGR